MHIHILGICGTFMGGIAALAQAAGHRVTGCDSNVYPPMSTQLEQLGIGLMEGYGADQLALQPDLFVIGNVVSRGNPLMEAILNAGLPYVSGPQWLGEHILAGRWTLAVAGTHGKTSTTSMLAWILEYAGLAPGFLVGGVPQNFGISARLPGAPRAEPQGQSPFFVLEADEYDTAFFDKRSKFVHYRPRTAILNNLEFDHADIFPDLAAIETQFHHLVRTVPSQGLVVANGREASLDRVLQRGLWTPVSRFGLPSAWDVAEVDANNGFTVLHQGQAQGRVQWSLLGEHNRLNALAAIIAARHVGVPVAEGCAALAEFQNVKRRMEIRGQVAGITVYDDFAHHPTAIRTTVAGLRQKVGAARILAILEPRSNTMKLGTLKDELADALQQADRVFCYSANLGWDAAASLQALGERVQNHEQLPALVQAVLSQAQAGDHLLVMSNGGFGGVHQQLLDGLQARHQA